MTMEEKLRHIDRALAKLTGTWFVNGEELATVSLDREERAVMVAALEIAGGICAIFKVGKDDR